MSADFWAGYISGAAGIIVGNPLDLIKTRLQASSGAGAGTRHAAANATSPASLRTTFDQAGTLVRGATAPILGYGALNALLFVTYNRSLAVLSPEQSDGPNYGAMYLAGVLGGIATFVVSAPTELIKVRAQVANSNVSPAGDTQLTSSLGIAKRIWRTEGLRGLYLGGGVTAVRDAVGYGWYFCSYDIAKRWLSQSAGDDPEALSAWRILLAGGVAGCISWASIFPLDVIKTRVQSQPMMVAASRLASPVLSPQLSPSQRPLLASKRVASPLSPSLSGSSGSSAPAESTNGTQRAVVRESTFAITANAYREGGMSVFFRGLGICSLRAFVVNAVQWAVYEWVMEVLVKPK